MTGCMCAIIVMRNANVAVYILCIAVRCDDWSVPILRGIVLP
jgi:hypothetical protein